MYNNPTYVKQNQSNFSWYFSLFPQKNLVYFYLWINEQKASELKGPMGLYKMPKVQRCTKLIRIRKPDNVVQTKDFC